MSGIIIKLYMKIEEKVLFQISLNENVLHSTLYHIKRFWQPASSEKINCIVLHKYLE